MPKEVTLIASLTGDDAFDAPSHARLTVTKKSAAFLLAAREAWLAASRSLPTRFKENLRRLSLDYDHAFDVGDSEAEDVNGWEDEAAGVGFEEHETYHYVTLLVDGDDFYFECLNKHGGGPGETDMMPWPAFEELVATLDDNPVAAPAADSEGGEAD